MAIKYFTNRPWRAVKPVVDRIGVAPTISHKGSQDITAAGINDTVFYPASWEVTQISASFSAITARDFSVAIQNGRAVVLNANDYLWFQLDTVGPTKITLDAGFYTGTDLAAHLEAKLDAAFAAASITFTVDYNSTNANSYTITPSSGTIRYWEYASSLQHRSIAGHLFGFEADSSAFSAALVSDTQVPSLDKKVFIIDLTADTQLSILDDDLRCLDIDQSILIESGLAAIVVDWEILYREKV
jgi:hypothetical protein